MGRNWFSRIIHKEDSRSPAKAEFEFQRKINTRQAEILGVVFEDWKETMQEFQRQKKEGKADHGAK